MSDMDKGYINSVLEDMQNSASWLPEKYLAVRLNIIEGVNKIRTELDIVELDDHHEGDLLLLKNERKSKRIT